MNPIWPTIAVPCLVQFVMFMRWLHRRVRDDEIQRTFVRDLGYAQLPYIHAALRQIASRFNIELPDPPPLRFLEVNGNGRK